MGKSDQLGGTLSKTTLDPASVASTSALPEIAALTIAGHPDPSRIGERALLPRLLAGGGKLSLSRVEPEFASVDGKSAPLRDAYLSRDPILLSRDPAGIRIDRRATKARVVVDGEEVESATWVTADQLARGVVIEIASRVVLVLGHARSLPLASRFGLVGDTDPMLALFEQIAFAARHPAPVLLRGPSGSGKELVARAIHDASPRASGPYVSVNVAAIPETTAAAELFGYQRGAFTGATANHSGWFGAAEGGTLFLDEIGEAPDAVQPMLLRALESGEIQPLGAQGSRRADVRVIAATDANLEGAAEAGKFRFPLLQRLASLSVRVPALAERRADVGRLLVHFVEQELAAIGRSLPDLDREDGKPWLGASIVARALRYDWPGNVRELRNFARELVLASDGRATARIGPTFDALLPPLVANRESVEPPLPAEIADEPRELGDEELVEVLRAHRFRVGATARALGISKNTLYQLMEKSGAIRKARDLGAVEISECAAECGGDTAAMAERLQVSERGLKLRMRELGLTGG